MGDSKKAPSQRQLRVGEELRHALSNVLLRNEVHEPELERISITVSEVRISPDLKNATAYVTPLAMGVTNGQNTIDLLNKLSASIRRASNRHLNLKYLPKLFFKLDRSFDTAGRINELLNQPEVVKDVVPTGREVDDGDE